MRTVSLLKKNLLTALGKLKQLGEAHSVDKVLVSLFHIDESSVALPDSLLKQRALLFELHDYYSANPNEFSKLSEELLSGNTRKFYATVGGLFYEKDNNDGGNSQFLYFKECGTIGFRKKIVNKCVGSLLFFCGRYEQGIFDCGQLIEGLKIDEGDRYEGCFKKQYLVSGKILRSNGKILEGKFRNEKLRNGTVTYSDGRTKVYKNGVSVKMPKSKTSKSKASKSKASKSKASKSKASKSKASNPPFGCWGFQGKTS